MRSSGGRLTFTSALLFGATSIVSAHGLDEGKIMDMGNASATMASQDAESPTYFHHAEHAGLMTAHIILMTIAWGFILPVGESAPPHILLRPKH